MTDAQREIWLARRDRRIRGIILKRGPFVFFDRVWESWIAAGGDLCLTPCRDEREAHQYLQR